MILNLNEPITVETLDKIANAYNNLKEEEKLDIYLSTVGGSVEVMEAIVHFLDNNADKVKLIGYGELCSAGFYIFFTAMCEKELLPSTIGMAHLVSVTSRFIGDPAIWKMKPESKMIHDWTKELKRTFMNLFKELGFTEDELTRVGNGDDVYFLPKRMNQLLKNQIKNAEDN